MPDLPTSPLRLRRTLPHEPSRATAAVAERVRADLAGRRGEEWAAWWAGRVAACPELFYLYATFGFDPYAEVDE